MLACTRCEHCMGPCGWGARLGPGAGHSLLSPRTCTGLAPNPPQRENKAPQTRVRKTRHDNGSKICTRRKTDDGRHDTGGDPAEKGWWRDNKRAGERRVAPQPRHTRAQPQSTRALAGLTWRAASRASASTHMRAATKHGGLSRAQCVHTPRGGSRGTADTPPRRYASLGSLAPNPPQRENKAPRTRVRKTRHDDALSKWVEDLHTQEDRRRTARYRRRPEAASRAGVSEAGCAGRVTQSRKSPMRRNGRRAGTPIDSRPARVVESAGGALPVGALDATPRPSTGGIVAAPSKTSR